MSQVFDLAAMPASPSPRDEGVGRGVTPSPLNFKLKTLNSPHEHGLSLIEMMVTVTLLALIIIGLVAMFDQTRKAFVAGVANVDYEDAGRIALDIIARDMQQTASANAGVLYNSVTPGSTAKLNNSLNFYSADDLSFSPLPPAINVYGDTNSYAGQRVLFTTQYNQQWNAIGYWLSTNSEPKNVGALYQYRTSGTTGSAGPVSESVFNEFSGDTGTNLVIDGVVDFRLLAYDASNNLITPNSPFIVGTVPNPGVTASLLANGDYNYAFSNSVVPAYVEIELGVLETPALTQYRALAGNNAQTYLKNHIGQIHIFKQRVSIPGANRTALP